MEMLVERQYSRRQKILSAVAAFGIASGTVGAATLPAVISEGSQEARKTTEAKLGSKNYAFSSATISPHGLRWTEIGLDAALSAEAQRVQAHNEMLRQAMAAAKSIQLYRQAQPQSRQQHKQGPAVRSTSSNGAFLDCVRQRESEGIYNIHNLGGSGASGAYQFMQGTWNTIAQESGRGDLVGVDPAAASPGDQDAMAQAQLATHGRGAWDGGRWDC